MEISKELQKKKTAFFFSGKKSASFTSSGKAFKHKLSVGCSCYIYVYVIFRSFYEISWGQDNTKIIKEDEGLDHHLPCLPKVFGQTRSEQTV